MIKLVFFKISILLVKLASLVAYVRASSSEDKTTYTISSTTRALNKTICSCQYDNDNDFVSLACPSGGYRINIIDAFLFDTIVPLNGRCLPKPDNVPIIDSNILSLLQIYCNDSVCDINMTLLDSLITDTKTSCLSSEIIWNCYKPIATYSIQNQSMNQAYSFTYFFYIITLVLSSSCILIGGLFIIRRRNQMVASNRSGFRQNRGFVSSSGTYRDAGLNSNSNNGNNSNGNVWTTGNAYPPPTYDHIDDSAPVNPPPSYNSALLLNYQLKEGNKEANKNETTTVLYRSNNNNNNNNNQNANNPIALRESNVNTNSNNLNSNSGNANLNDSNQTNENNEGQVLIRLKSNGLSHETSKINQKKLDSDTSVPSK